MQQALYKIKDSINKVINANKITKEEYQNIYNGHLYCSHPGCMVRMVYVETESTNMTCSENNYFRKSYFRSLPNSNHIEGCINKINRNCKKQSSCIDNHEEYKVSTQHKKRALKRTSAKRHGTEKTLTSQNSENKDSPKTDKKNVKHKSKEVYTLNKKRKINPKKREVKIYPKSIEGFLKSKDGGIYSLYGDLCKIDYTGQDMFFVLKNENNSSIRVCVSNEFQNDKIGINKLSSIKNYIEKLNKKIEIIIICYKFKRNEEIIGEVGDFESILLDDMFFDDFVKHIKIKLDK